jgi:hypothetical protein
MPRALAHEQHVETQVEQHARDRGEVDQHGKRPVAGLAEPPDHVEHCEEGDQAREHFRGEHDRGVAEGTGT